MPLITMVFTDVVESSATKRDTSLGRDNRERDRAYLEKVQTPHFELVRASCQAYGGREVRTMGDAFFLAFEDPTQAVRCAINIQQQLAEKTIETPRGALRLRIGIHSGFPEYFEESWHGTDVDTAARVEAAATANQILMSSRTYELVRQMTDVKFYAHGEFALKGVDRVGLWEVAWDAKGPRRTALRPLGVSRRRKRYLLIAGAVAGTLLVLASGAYLYRSYTSGHIIMPTKPRPAVAVMDFKNLGKPDVEWLSNALSEMLNTELGSSEALRTVFPEDVSVARADLALSIVPSFNSATLSKIRRILHSEYVISGAYVAMGNEPNDSIHIDVHVQDADSGETVAAFGEDGTIGTLHEVLTKAGAELLTRLGVHDQQASGNPQNTAVLPSDPEALRLYTDGLARLRAFDALGARDSLQRSIALSPDFALPHFALARAWKLLGYDGQAHDEAKRAVELSGNLPPREQRSIEAEYHELSSQWDQAIAIYQSLQVIYPDEPNYSLLLANAQTSAGKGQDALATLAALAKEPQMKDDPRVDLYVALAAESLSDVHKQRDAAEAAAEKATRQESRLLAAHAYWQLCSAYYALGEFQKGETACDESNRAAPFDDDIRARSQTVWANLLEAQGSVHEALDMRRQALETARKIGSQKDIIGALQNLADMLSSQGDADEARKDYEAAFQVAQSIGDKLGLVKLENSLADDLNSNGDFAGAQATYQQSLGTAREIGDTGGTAMALENLSSIQLQQGHLAQAQDSVQQALVLQRQSDLQSDMPFALRTLGDVFLAKGDLQKARANYDESLKMSTAQKSPAEIAASRAALAALTLEDGKPSEAQSLAQQAADEFGAEKLVDNEADARNTLARALIEQGNLAEARTQIDRGLRLAPQGRAIRVSLAISDARLKAREGKAPEARKALEDCLATASKMAMLQLVLETRLAQAEVEAAADPKSAAVHLRELEQEATSKGYLLIASRAQRALKKLQR